MIRKRYICHCRLHDTNCVYFLVWNNRGCPKMIVSCLCGYCGGVADSNIWRTIEVLFLKQPLILPFLCHKSTITCQIDLYKVSNSKLKPDPFNYVKTKIVESTAPPQQPHKQGTHFLGHTVVCCFFMIAIMSSFAECWECVFRSNEMAHTCPCGSINIWSSQWLCI